MFKQWVIDRLQEPSTQRGIVLLITAATGFTVPPELVSQVILLGLTVSGAIGVVRADPKK